MTILHKTFPFLFLTFRLWFNPNTSRSKCPASEMPYIEVPNWYDTLQLPVSVDVGYCSLFSVMIVKVMDKYVQLSSVWIQTNNGLDERISIPGRSNDRIFFPMQPRPERLWGPPRLQSIWVPMALTCGVKRSRHGADHSPPFSAVVKNAVSSSRT